jgi:hypothetical protein
MVYAAAERHVLEEPKHKSLIRFDAGREPPLAGFCERPLRTAD